MEPTIFTRILRREVPAAIVYEDELTFAFMDAGQLNPGHVLVATRQPAETLLDIDEDTAAALFRTVHRVAKAVHAAFQPEGLTILQANKASGWQTVPHLHVHVLPRHADDGVGLVWPRKNPSIDELRQLAAKIRL
ncbi:HIT family protein [Ramlibacter tataouinensis]|uniref:HIT family protein n=1 Tax=Ramlibacter tataouinensis TaxID=94132 RepID=UPI0022F38F8A|nr:HIT family protein [Ramlibacter tataouinensis]WBY00341.1 HIT family protein [Ramlibacter tataouinensis]